MSLDFNPAIAAATDYETAAILHTLLIDIAENEGLDTSDAKAPKPDFHTFDKKRVKRAFSILLKSEILKAEKVAKIDLLEAVKRG